MKNINAINNILEKISDLIEKLNKASGEFSNRLIEAHPSSILKIECQYPLDPTTINGYCDRCWQLIRADGNKYHLHCMNCATLIANTLCDKKIPVRTCNDCKFPKAQRNKND